MKPRIRSAEAAAGMAMEALDELRSMPQDGHVRQVTRCVSALKTWLIAAAKEEQRVELESTERAEAIRVRLGLCRHNHRERRAECFECMALARAAKRLRVIDGGRGTGGGAA